MKILCVVNYYKHSVVYGGPARSVPLMCEALAHAGAEVTVFTTNANGGRLLDVPLRSEINDQGVHIRYFPVLPFVPHQYFLSPELSNACLRETHNFDIAILETLFTEATGPAVKACRRSSVPYIIPPRGQLLPWALSQKRLKKELYLRLVGRSYLDHAAGLQCADEIEADVVTALGLQAPKFVVPNGISITAWDSLPARGALRKRLGIGTMEPVLLFLGRLHRVKRPDLALKTLAGMRRRDVHLIFAGPDEQNYQQPLIQEARSLGCENRIHFTGLLTSDEIRQAFADADLLLMPSAMESFGMAVVEALASGLPVLVSENIPLGVWIEKSGAGCTVPLNIDKLVQAADSMLIDREKLTQMGERGRLIMRERYDITKVARIALAHYDSILESMHSLS